MDGYALTFFRVLALLQALQPCRFAGRDAGAQPSTPVPSAFQRHLSPSHSCHLASRSQTLFAGSVLGPTFLTHLHLSTHRRTAHTPHALTRQRLLSFLRRNCGSNSAPEQHSWLTCFTTPRRGALLLNAFHDGRRMRHFRSARVGLLPLTCALFLYTGTFPHARVPHV